MAPSGVSYCAFSNKLGWLNTISRTTQLKLLLKYAKDKMHVKLNVVWISHVVGGELLIQELPSIFYGFAKSKVLPQDGSIAILAPKISQHFIFTRKEWCEMNIVGHLRSTCFWFNYDSPCFFGTEWPFETTWRTLLIDSIILMIILSKWKSGKIISLMEIRWGSSHIFTLLVIHTLYLAVSLYITIFPSVNFWYYTT